jgi:putative ABC transport system permease protein
MITIVLRHLARRRRRTILTIAGIALGTATYMVLLAAGQGLLDQFRESAKVLGAEVVVQQQGVTSPWNSLVPSATTDRLRELPQVRSVSRMILGKTRFLGASYFLMFGVAAEDPLLSDLLLVEGRPLAANAEPTQLLVGSWAADRFNLAAGHLIETRNRRFEVAGIYRTGRAVLDSGAIVDLPVAQALFNARDGSNLVFLDLSNPDDGEEVVAVISREFPEVEAHLTSEWVESYGQVRVIQTFARFLALIALLIAMLGVSNVLHISVSERLQELAVLRAIGWSRRRVASLVLAEGGVLSVVGGLCGIPLAAAVLLAVGSVNLGGYTTAGLIPLGLPVGAAGEGVAVSAAAGVIGSLAPLVRALRVQPARALHSL